LREGGAVNWNAGVDPLLAEQKPCDLWELKAGPQYVVCSGLDFPLNRLYHPCSKQEKRATFKLEYLWGHNSIRPSHKDARDNQS